MAKLTKQQAKKHAFALEILKNDVLTDEQKELVFINYQEGANNVNSDAGAFFSPLSLAFDFAYDAMRGNGEYIDLCAGIGALSYALIKRNENITRLVCVDINPEYVAIGKKLVPEAEWFCMSVTDIEAIKSLGRFEVAVSNPPYGSVRTFKDCESPFYKGSNAEFSVIDIAGLVANYGAFIIPQGSSSFKLSGVRCYEDLKGDSLPSKVRTFQKQTGIVFDMGLGVDTSNEGYYIWSIDEVNHGNNWHGVSPTVEFVMVDYPSQYFVDDTFVIPEYSETQLSMFE